MMFTGTSSTQRIARFGPKVDSRPNRNRALSVFAASLALLVSMAGCSATPPLGGELERDPSAKAVLDYSTGRITTPVSAYAAPVRLEFKVEKASELLLAPCLKEQGFTPTPTKIPTDADYPARDIGRMWGPWSVKLAQRRGYELDDGESLKRSQQNFGIPGYDDAVFDCRDKHQKEFEQLTEGDVFSQESIDSSISVQARVATQNTDEYKSIHNEYDECIRSKGYVPLPNDEWGIENPPSGPAGEKSPEKIKAAVDQAQCATDTQAVQRLADMTASFEAPLIDKHQAQLGERMKEIEAAEKRLDAYIKERE